MRYFFYLTCLFVYLFILSSILPGCYNYIIKIIGSYYYKTRSLLKYYFIGSHILTNNKKIDLENWLTREQIGV